MMKEQIEAIKDEVQRQMTDDQDWFLPEYFEAPDGKFGVRIRLGKKILGEYIKGQEPDRLQGLLCGCDDFKLLNRVREICCNPKYAKNCTSRDSMHSWLSELSFINQQTKENLNGNFMIISGLSEGIFEIEYAKNTNDNIWGLKKACENFRELLLQDNLL